MFIMIKRFEQILQRNYSEITTTKTNNKYFLVTDLIEILHLYISLKPCVGCTCICIYKNIFVETLCWLHCPDHVRSANIGLTGSLGRDSEPRLLVVVLFRDKYWSYWKSGGFEPQLLVKVFVRGKYCSYWKSGGL